MVRYSDEGCKRLEGCLEVSRRDAAVSVVRE